jgi:hypothetical protein
MEKAKAKKGAKLTCVPCGKEVVVDNCGVFRATLWCCGKPMSSKPKVDKKKK